MKNVVFNGMDGDKLSYTVCLDKATLEKFTPEQLEALIRAEFNRHILAKIQEAAAEAPTEPQREF